MKNLCVLGSTGSIGRNVLAIAALFPERFRLQALCARSSVGRLARQIERFTPELAVVADRENADALQRALPAGCATRVLYGPEGYRQAATLPSVDAVVTAVVGAAGLLPTLAAIEAGKEIALANKETLVMAGALVTRAATAAGIRILPVDSEHSAIFQCLEGQRRQDLERLLITASGGPFRTLPAEAFAAITPQQALAHPTWQMGNKISIDSATLMNKGLEVIEARWLFDVPLERIQVIVHPQSIVHSMVALRDGSVLAQMGTPDMKGAIAYALSYPERLPLRLPLPDFKAIGALTFEEPDLQRFPCLALAFRAGTIGHTLPAVLNAANEVAVEAFLNRRLPFARIAAVIEQTMERHQVITNPDLEEILAADREARREAGTLIAQAQA